MKIQRTVLDDAVACLTLTGDFDAFAANPFLEQVEAIVQTGTVNVIANLRLVLFINSTAVGSLIKARKRLRGLGGDLVFSEPSQRVRETLDLLGIGQLIKNFKNDDEALKHMKAATTDQVDVPADNVVLVRSNNADLQKKLSAFGGIAKMSALEENSITFVSPGDATTYPARAEIKVKFRLPLFRRAYYFDFPATVKSATKGADGVKVLAEFGEIIEADQRAIAQFVRDLRLLREEVRGADS